MGSRQVELVGVVEVEFEGAGLLGLQLVEL